MTISCINHVRCRPVVFLSRELTTRFQARGWSDAVFILQVVSIWGRSHVLLEDTFQPRLSAIEKTGALFKRISELVQPCGGRGHLLWTQLGGIGPI